MNRGGHMFYFNKKKNHTGDYASFLQHYSHELLCVGVSLRNSNTIHWNYGCNVTKGKEEEMGTSLLFWKALYVNGNCIGRLHWTKASPAGGVFLL